MSRLYDRMMTGPLRPPWWVVDGLTADAWKQQVQSTRSRLDGAERIVADNVCEYLYAGTNKEAWDFKRDFPNVAPPFPCFWVECCRPSRVVSTEGDHAWPIGSPRAWGILVEAEEMARVGGGLGVGEATSAIVERLNAYPRDLVQSVVDKGEQAAREQLSWNRIAWGAYERDVAEMMLLLRMLQTGRITEEQLRQQGEQGGWHLDITAWADFPSVGLMGPVAMWQLIVGPRGDVLHSQYGVIAGRNKTLPDPTIGEWASTLIFAPLLALSFLHCKNVTIIDNNAPRAERRRAEREGTKPPVTFKTLDIRPMQEVLRREGNIEKTGLKMALHICRGHFATYSEERPLFGRVAGTFWKPMHVRGSAKEGVVVKDYAVHQPMEVSNGG